MYNPRFFKLHELISRKCYREMGERGWWLLDERLLWTVDQLRERFGRATINNWKFGGPRNYSGLRQPGDPFYNRFSQHSFGRAADIIFHDADAKEVRNDIMDNPTLDAYKYIKGLELKVGWVHVDLRYADKLITFNQQA